MMNTVYIWQKIQINCHNVSTLRHITWDKWWWENSFLVILLCSCSTRHALHPDQKEAVLQYWWSQANPQETGYILKILIFLFKLFSRFFFLCFFCCPFKFQSPLKPYFQAHFPSSPTTTRARNLMSEWAEIFMLSVNCSSKELNCYRTRYGANIVLRLVVFNVAVTTF